MHKETGMRDGRQGAEARFHMTSGSHVTLHTAVWHLPAVSLGLSPRSLVWLPGTACSSAFSGEGGKLWARVARSALRYCSRVT